MVTAFSRARPKPFIGTSQIGTQTRSTAMDSAITYDTIICPCVKCSTRSNTTSRQTRDHGAGNRMGRGPCDVGRDSPYWYVVRGLEVQTVQYVSPPLPTARKPTLILRICAPVTATRSAVVTVSGHQWHFHRCCRHDTAIGRLSAAKKAVTRAFIDI